MKIVALLTFVYCLVGATASAIAAESAIAKLQRYVGVDTTNPPGNETRAVDFFSSIFEQAGIEFGTAESAPGRGNIWARLEGGDAPGLVLLHHTDVVPATSDAWDTDPLKAVVKDGNLYGRGTLDTKSLGITHLEAFLALHRSSAPMSRDVIFVASADEEAGGIFGAGWLVEHHPEIFAGAGFLLNEGGIGIESAGDIVFRIEVAQKRPYWIRLTARDKPGHGSSPRTTSAPGRLIAALQRIQEAPFEARITAPVRAMFATIAPREGADWQAPLSNIDNAISDPEFLRKLQAEKHRLHALVRNTCSITMLTGSKKINVVPPTASAELDCRILPDQDEAAFRDVLVALINDTQIEIEEILNFGPAQSDPDTDLFRLLQRTSEAYYPNAGVVASVAGGFTDSHFFRERGIISYGYAPFVVPGGALGGVHGNNEHISIETFERGMRMMTEIVAEFAARVDP